VAGTGGGEVAAGVALGGNAGGPLAGRGGGADGANAETGGVDDGSAGVDDRSKAGGVEPEPVGPSAGGVLEVGFAGKAGGVEPVGASCGVESAGAQSAAGVSTAAAATTAASTAGVLLAAGEKVDAIVLDRRAAARRPMRLCAGR
jgi:hypothetical protein